MTVDHAHVSAVALPEHEIVGSIGKTRIVVTGDAHIRREPREAARAAGETLGHLRHVGTNAPYALRAVSTPCRDHRRSGVRCRCMRDRPADTAAAPRDTVGRVHADVSRETRRLHLLHEARLHCREGCTACCVDGLTVFDVEAEAIRLHHAGLLATATPHEEGACAFLDGSGSCRIYDERPQVCRTQGLPLRWTEEREGELVELRDICPLNDPGEPIVELPADACWSIGPVEERLARLELARPGPKERVRLRDLFERPAPTRAARSTVE